MHAETTEMIAKWINGPRGVNHYLQHTRVDDGQPAPQPVALVTSSYSDPVSANTLDHTKLFPHVVVDAVLPVKLSGDGPGNIFEGDIIVDIVVFCQSSDLSVALWELSAITRAIGRSLRELEFSNDMDTRPFKTLNNVSLMAMKDAEMYPPMMGTDAHTLASLTRYTFTIREVK